MNYAFQQIRNFFETLITIYAYLDIKMKIIFSILGGVILSPVFVFIKDFSETFLEIIIPETAVIGVTFALLILNTIFGGIKHKKLGEFKAKDLYTKFIFKLALACGGLILFQISTFISRDSNFFSEVFNFCSMSTMYVWLGFDTAKQMYISSNGSFPPKIIMERFGLDIKKLIKENEIDEK